MRETHEGRMDVVMRDGEANLVDPRSQTFESMNPGEFGEAVAAAAQVEFQQNLSEQVLDNMGIVTGVDGTAEGVQ